MRGRCQLPEIHVEKNSDPRLPTNNERNNVRDTHPSTVSAPVPPRGVGPQTSSRPLAHGLVRAGHRDPHRAGARVPRRLLPPTAAHRTARLALDGRRVHALGLPQIHPSLSLPPRIARRSRAPRGEAAEDRYRPRRRPRVRRFPAHCLPRFREWLSSASDGSHRLCLRFHRTAECPSRRRPRARRPPLALGGRAACGGSTRAGPVSRTRSRLFQSTAARGSALSLPHPHRRVLHQRPLRPRSARCHPRRRGDPVLCRSHRPPARNGRTANRHHLFGSTLHAAARPSPGRTDHGPTGTCGPRRDARQLVRGRNLKAHGRSPRRTRRGR